MLEQLHYATISEVPSALLDKVLQNEASVVAGGSYLALGFVGMQDAIVLVDSEGSVVQLPYNEGDFTIE